MARKKEGTLHNLEKDIEKEVKRKVKATPTLITSAPIKQASPESYFILCDGRHIKDIEELTYVLYSSGEDIFSYHANASKNDFSSWIADIFGEEKLASDIRQKGRMETLMILYKFLYEKHGGTR